MHFESRVFKLPKDSDHPEQDQDACQIDGQRGIAVIADGVSSGIFSRQWADILTKAVVADLPDPDKTEHFARWLTLRREAWAAEVDVSQLAWHQKPRLRQGAFSTLLWVRLVPDQANPEPDSWLLDAFALGDSCLFHVRQGQLLSCFPIQSAAELEANPLVVGSVDLNRDHLLRFRRFSQPCLEDDLVVLCTDAVAEWALRLAESGQPPNWEDYWGFGEEAWRQQIAALREARQMRVDDATLALLRVVRRLPAPRGDCSSPSAQKGESAGVAEQLNATVKAVSEHLASRFGQAVRKLKEVSESAGSALRKRLDKH